MVEAKPFERFRHEPADFVGVMDPRLIYVGVKRREDFDRIGTPAHDHGENDRGHVLTKVVEQDGVRVVFQYWLKTLTVEAIIADRKAREAATNG